MSKSERNPADVGPNGEITGGAGSAETLHNLVNDGRPTPEPSPSPSERGGKEGGGGGKSGGGKSGDGPKEGGTH